MDLRHHRVFDLWMRKKPLKIMLWFLLGGFLIMVGVNIGMQFFERQLQDQTGFGVLDLEFVWTVDRTQEILTAWGPQLISLEIIVTFLDFIFMPAYATVFTSLSWILTRIILEREESLNVTSQRPQIFFFIGILPWVAILGDFIENLNILFVLYRPDSFHASHPVIISLSASIKFGLLGVVLIGILAQMLILGWLRLKNRDRNNHLERK